MLDPHQDHHPEDQVEVDIRSQEVDLDLEDTPGQDQDLQDVIPGVDLTPDPKEDIVGPGHEVQITEEEVGVQLLEAEVLLQEETENVVIHLLEIFKY